MIMREVLEMALRKALPRAAWEIYQTQLSKNLPDRVHKKDRR
jgi:hypothetical protein